MDEPEEKDWKGPIDIEEKRPNGWIQLLMLGLFVLTLWAIVSILASIGGCAKSQRWQRDQIRKQFFKELLFYRDPKTGLCFAVRGESGFSWVPCKGTHYGLELEQ